MVDHAWRRRSRRVYRRYPVPRNAPLRATGFCLLSGVSTNLSWRARLIGERGSMPVVIGLMSGTSADGVDAALVRLEGGARLTQVHVEAFHTYPFPPGMRQAILAAS